MAFEVVPLGRHLFPRAAALEVHCGKNRITFSKEATRIIGDSPSVLLLWDKDNNLAAVRGQDTPHSFPLYRSKTGSQSFITCTAFLKATGMQGTGRVQAELVGLNIQWAIKGRSGTGAD